MKFALFTAPLAAVVTTTLVALPWFKVMVSVSVSEIGLATDTVKVFVPARPIIFRSLNDTVPSAAFLTVFPENVAPAIVSVTSGVPVVIKFPSTSLMSTSIAVPRV